MSLVANFSINYHQYLDPDGKATQALPDWTKNNDFLIALYQTLVSTRVFDNKAINLQRTGKMGTYASARGQEAIGVGMGFAMQPDDVLLPYYRDYGAMFKRGVKMSEILLYWGGDERGSCFTVGGKDFPICVPIATQCLHAAGVATAIQYRKEKRAVLVTIGEGGTSKGDFYEALNVAGTWQLPVVFVVCNNQWAISVPRGKQTAAETFAQKGIAAGIGAEQVDGNDIIAVYDRVNIAMTNAREHYQPYLIEAITYRLHDHTTADDATRYRPSDELKDAEKREPIKRLKHFLLEKGLWDDNKEAALITESQARVEQAVHEYLTTQPEPKTAMFDYLFESLPLAHQAQREQLIK